METLPVPPDLQDALELVKPRYGGMERALMNSYMDTVKAKDHLKDGGVDFTMKPRTKGSLLNDVLAHHLKVSFEKDIEVEVVNLHDVVGLMIQGKVYIKFNKMDKNHSPSIQKRKWYKAITHQGQELKGLAPHIVKMWAGIIPVDKPWSDVARCSLVYYEGGGVVWATNLVDDTVEQLSIQITQANPKRRTKPKKKDGEQDVSTGTNNQ